LTFDGGAELIGAAFTAVTAGSLAGALLAAARGAPAAGTLSWSAAAMGATLGLTAAAPNAPLAFVGLVGLGVMRSVFLSAVIAVLQTTDPRLMGRVMALFSVLLLGGTAVGGPITSALADAAGARAPFLLGALASLVAALVARRPALSVRPSTPPSRTSQRRV
jgi:MFS family permease